MIYVDKNKKEDTIGFNVVSDLHMDFYFDWKNPYDYINDFKNNIQNKCDYLIVAGDIANNNKLSYIFLESMNYFYKKVFVIDGNHEYYGDWGKIDRYKGLKEITKKLKNIVFLDENDVIDVEGIKIAGRMMMYNIEDRLKDYQFFKTISNDSRFIPEWMVKKKHKEEIEDYNRLIDDVDIFISHIPLIPQKNSNYIPEEYRDISLYYNSGVKIKANKIYINGHVHHRQFNTIPLYENNEYIGESYNINVATGYPYENKSNKPHIESIYIKKGEN